MEVLRTLFVSTLLLLILLQTTESAKKKKKGAKKSDLIHKECETCRKIVSGFYEGIKSTAKGHFGGGNTAWEERALGSYANSETRFVEISEKLCTSSEHECNRMFEEHEELLEEWWNDNNVDENKDLLRWFCIEQIKVCCPNNTFGSDCKECPGGAERPCTGNGHCRGEGTRGGSGKCKCDDGYKGELCDDCKDNFFEETKNKTHVICGKCNDACANTCWGPTPKDCDECKDGWEESEDEGCQDVDECAKTDDQPCEENEFCTNTVGSYECIACGYACDSCLGTGPDKCIKCKSGFHMIEGTCEDIDECSDLNIECAEFMSCYNNPGSYYCDCQEGYKRFSGECVSEEALKMLEETAEEGDEEREPTQDENGVPFPINEKVADESSDEGKVEQKDVLEEPVNIDVTTTQMPQQNAQNLNVPKNGNVDTNETTSNGRVEL